MQEIPDFWEPVETSKTIFISIGLGRNLRELQEYFLQLVRHQRPNAIWTPGARTETAALLRESVLQHFHDSRHKRDAYPLIDQELEYQNTKIMDVLVSPPQPKAEIIPLIIAELIDTDHHYAIQVGGSGSHTKDPYASYLRYCLLNNFPFPMTSELSTAMQDLRPVWEDEQQKAHILNWKATNRALTNCTINEPILKERLTHVKSIWELRHPGQSFDIF